MLSNTGITTASDLYNLAHKKYGSSYELKTLLTAIDEAKSQQLSYLIPIGNMYDNCNKIENEGQFFINMSDSLAIHAIGHGKATAKLSTLFFTLACMLEHLGETINY